MDAGIRELIDGRREVIRHYYDLPPEEQQKAEALFARMEQTGGECRNRAEFKRRFATQTMEREYNLLLRDFSAYIRPDIEFK
jgi:hypothetical protein